jgi:glycosyltransferase involved in cell wall biosynthesis
VDGEDSLMIPKNDPGALTQAIQKLLSDKALSEKIVARGYDRYQNEFTKEKTVAAYIDYFLTILKREHIL